MHTPIFVIDKENGEVDYFVSLSSARAYIEPYDVDVCSVYSADGSIIDVVLDKTPELSRLGIPGQVRLTPSSKSDADGLRHALLAHLRHLRQNPKFVDSLGENPDLEKDDEPLSSLIDTLRSVQRPG